jgi:hypothetical protein
VTRDEALFLLSPRGGRALAAAREARAAGPLAVRRALEGDFSPAEARAAAAMDDLRRRAAAKTPFAERLFLTREGLEQATAFPVARERARRFRPFGTVADLGAGIGLDAIALAGAGPRVVAVERDPVRAAFLRRNLVEAGVGDRVEVVEADFVGSPPEADAAFLDPDRRPGGRRTRDPDRFEPPVEAWRPLAAAYGALLVKGPPVPPRALEDERLEMVSLDGEMRESRFGTGALEVPARRRALVLPGGAALEGDGAPWPAPRAPLAGDLVVDPDPAVVVAGLVGEGAREAGLAPVHARIALLCGPREARAPGWGRAVRVEEVLPPDARAVSSALAARDVGRLSVRSRGVAAGADPWLLGLRPSGTLAAVLVVTRGPDGRRLVLLGRDEAAAS